jgi:hypothetical protein
VEAEANGYGTSVVETLEEPTLSQTSVQSPSAEAQSTGAAVATLPATNNIRASNSPNGTFEVNAVLADEHGFDRLIKILQLNRLLYQEIPGDADMTGPRRVEGKSGTY